MTRHSIDPQDTDGGVSAAGIADDAKSLNGIGERLNTFARSLGARPEWTDSPAVQGWHRSDGSPSNPRIWSPDYGTTERWSTPSLRDVHWSDLVGVTPLYPIETATQACPDSDAHWRLDQALTRIERTRSHWKQCEEVLAEVKDRLEQAEKEQGEAERALDAACDHARKVERERDDARHEVLALRDDLARAEAINHEITDEMVERARRAYDSGQDHIGILVAALKEPPARPEGAEELETVIGLNAGKWTTGAEDVRALADLLASHGVRVVTEEQS